jgi:DNA-directed RNA polymerase specialized sigma24 family protein
MPIDRSSGTKADKNRELTRGAFDMLLARLDPDRDEAGRKYDELRRKLTKFFGLWGCSSPEEYADESLDRTARKIFEGEDVKNLNGFVLGVARLVHKEMVKREIRERNAVEGLQRVSTAGRDPGGDEKRLRCYEHCLTSLPADDRNLFVTYYQGEGRMRARQREALRLQLDITLNLLRVRAFRVRKSLARCVRKCLGQQSEDVMN